MPKNIIKQSKAQADVQESSRTQKPRKYTKTERSHAENQERAYIAASRRSDRSLEARMESARRASEIHKQRTGKSFRITEKAVMNEEMYEEEDPNYDRIVNSLVNSYNMPNLNTQFGGPGPLQRGGSISQISPMSIQLPQFSPSTPNFPQHQTGQPFLGDEMHQLWVQNRHLFAAMNWNVNGSNQQPQQLSANMAQTPGGFYQQPMQSPANFNNSPLPSPHPHGSGSTPTTPMQQQARSYFQQPHPSPHTMHPSPRLNHASPHPSHPSPHVSHSSPHMSHSSPHTRRTSHVQRSIPNARRPTSHELHQPRSASSYDWQGTVAASPMTVSTPTTDSHYPTTPQPLVTSQLTKGHHSTNGNIASGVSVPKHPVVRPEEQALDTTVSDLPTADMLFEDCIDFNFVGNLDDLSANVGGVVDPSPEYQQAFEDLTQWGVDGELFANASANQFPDGGLNISNQDFGGF